VRRTLCTLGGRIVTSPLAFFVAFVIDVVGWGSRELLRRMRAL
jgi:hypothetical protein